MHLISIAFTTIVIGISPGLVSVGGASLINLNTLTTHFTSWSASIILTGSFHLASALAVPAPTTSTPSHHSVPSDLSDAIAISEAPPSFSQSEVCADDNENTSEEESIFGQGLTDSSKESNFPNPPFTTPVSKTVSSESMRPEAITTHSSPSEVPAKKHYHKNLKTKISTMRNNFRWAIHGILTELFHNVFLRQRSPLIHDNIPQKGLQNGLSSQNQTRLQNNTLYTHHIPSSRQWRYPAKHEIAVVTGATGGIGSEIARELAFRGYDVLVAARDISRGEALVNDIRDRLKQSQLLPMSKVDDEEISERKTNESEREDCDDRANDEGAMPRVQFVEYHADRASSALDVALVAKNLTESAISSSNALNPRRKLSILINNAGIMGKSKQLTMKVNLIGPALLTFALLPLMISPAVSDSVSSSEDDSGVTTNKINSTIITTPPMYHDTIPMVINVGSSAHLRASTVGINVSEKSNNSNDSISAGEQEMSYLDTLPDVPDSDLSTYAESKLAIMQFSTLLRNSLVSHTPATIPSTNTADTSTNNTKSNNTITATNSKYTNHPKILIIDAHPGLVWTPLLQNHIGNRATNILQKTGLANWIYKSPLEGAQAIVSAVDYANVTHFAYFTNGIAHDQVYFVNGKPGGHAAVESRDVNGSKKLWHEVIAKELKWVVPIPKVLMLSYDS